MKLSQEALEALKKLAALQELGKRTGTITRRAESLILRSLPDTVLIEVATATAQNGKGETKVEMNRTEEPSNVRSTRRS